MQCCCKRCYMKEVASVMLLQYFPALQRGVNCCTKGLFCYNGCSFSNSQVSFSSTGNRLLAAGEDGHIQLWYRDTIACRDGPLFFLVVNLRASFNSWAHGVCCLRHSGLESGLESELLAHFSYVGYCCFYCDGSAVCPIRNLSLQQVRKICFSYAKIGWLCHFKTISLL